MQVILAEKLRQSKLKLYPKIQCALFRNWKIVYNFRISFVIYCEKPKRVMKSLRTNWFNILIPCYKSLIPIKMENYNFLKWQSKLYEYCTVWSEGFLYKVAPLDLKILPIMYFVIHNSVVLSKILKIVVPFWLLFGYVDYYQNNQFYRVKNWFFF